MSPATGIFLAALGITALEMVEASAVGLTLYADSKRATSFVAIALGALVVFVPAFAIGTVMTYLPITLIRLVGAALLLYFGIRLVKSSRRAVLNSREKTVFVENFTRGLMITGFSVGAIEAFEASIVLIGLLPNDFNATILGFGSGLVLVVVATFALRKQVRKVKQALTKVFVSALLLTFASFWFAEVFVSPSDLYLIPLFAVFAIAVYLISNRPSPAPTVNVPAGGSMK